METEISPVEQINIEQKQSIKLIKTSKNTYNWELKILDLNVNELEKLNNEMLKRFGEKKEWKLK